MKEPQSNMVSRELTAALNLFNPAVLTLAKAINLLRKKLFVLLEFFFSNKQKALKPTNLYLLDKQHHTNKH